MSKLQPITAARKAAAWAAAGTLAASPIAGYEGLRQLPYKDVVGIWTDCYGRTEGVVPGEWKSKAFCDTWLSRDIKRHADGMQKCVFVDVPIVSLSAFISFGYNVGVGAFCRSTLVKKLNSGDLKAACDELPKWNKAGGVVWKGLVKRRAGERELCLSGLTP